MPAVQYWYEENNWFMNGDELRARRTALRFTQEELAKFLSVAPNTIARWERGEREIPTLADYRVDWLEQRLNLLPIHREIFPAGFEWLATIENIIEASMAPIDTFTILFKQVKGGNQQRTLRFTIHAFTLYKELEKVRRCVSNWLLNKEGDGEINYDVLKESVESQEAKQ